MAYRDSNDHVTKIQDGGQVEVCTLWVLIIIIIVIRCIEEK